MLEAAQEPILSAVAHEAAGPAIAHEETSNPALALVDRLVGTGVEACAAFLVAAEIVVLFVGVVSRYVFRNPIVWSDELASFLFLWLAMLGSVVAFRNAGHMRMTALVSKSRPSVQTFFDVLAGVASIAFLLLTIGPALEFAHEERLITTPALEISGAWRASSLPVGLGLMLMTGIISLLRSRHRLAALLAILTVAAVAGAFYAAGGVFPKLGNYNLLLFFVGLVGGLVFAGVPIAFAFGLATVGYIALTTRVPTLVVIGRMDEGMSHLILLAVPLFVFLGLLIEMTGMARAMVGFLASIGHWRADRNDSTLNRPDHHRFGDGRFDLGIVYRWNAARFRAWRCSLLSRVAALSARGPERCEASDPQGDRSLVWHRPSCPLATFRNSCSGCRGHCDGNGSVNHRHRLRRNRRHPDISPVPVEALVSVLEGIPAIVLFGPLMFPIARQVGVHEVHYAMVVILAMGIGLFAPPFGVGYYAACAISQINPDEGIKPIVGYILALIAGLAVVIAIPWISTGFL